MWATNPHLFFSGTERVRSPTVRERMVINVATADAWASRFRDGFDRPSLSSPARLTSTKSICGSSVVRLPIIPR